MSLVDSETAVPFGLLIHGTKEQRLDAFSKLTAQLAVVVVHVARNHNSRLRKKFPRIVAIRRTRQRVESVIADLRLI